MTKRARLAWLNGWKNKFLEEKEYHKAVSVREAYVYIRDWKPAPGEPR